MIAIAAGERRFGPVDGLRAMEQRHGALEATDAAEGLGRQTDFVAEQADEAARAHAGLIDHVGDAARASAKRRQRMADRGMMGLRPMKQGQQHMLEQQEPRLCSLGREQALAQFGGSPAPQRLERYMSIAQLVDRQRKEGKRTARLEVDADDRGRPAGVQDEETRMRARNDGVEAHGVFEGLPDDLGFRDRNGFVDDLRDNRPVDRDTQNPQKLRREVRRRAQRACT